MGHKPVQYSVLIPRNNKKEMILLYCAILFYWLPILLYGAYLSQVFVGGCCSCLITQHDRSSIQPSWPLWSVSLLIPFDPSSCTCLHETVSGLAALPLSYPNLSAAFLFVLSAHHKQVLSSSLLLFCRILCQFSYSFTSMT